MSYRVPFSARTRPPMYGYRRSAVSVEIHRWRCLVEKTTCRRICEYVPGIALPAVPRLSPSPLRGEKGIVYSRSTGSARLRRTPPVATARRPSGANARHSGVRRMHGVLGRIHGMLCWLLPGEGFDLAERPKQIAAHYPVDVVDRIAAIEEFLGEVGIAGYVFELCR